ncbi:MAG: glycoside hydrolase family 47 protein [Ignavibacteriaceae bacterium]
MKSFVYSVLTASILSIFFSISAYGQDLTVAKDKNRITDIDKNKLAEEVRKEFLHAWNGYKEYAWGHDELKPLSKSYRDWYKVSLYMTPVDAFDTMVLMGLKKQADEAKELILNHLSFDQDISVKTFEITIRMLGGLLSSYQLDGDKRFLSLAEDLGKRLIPAFNSKTGMPYGYINLKSGETSGEVTNPAEIGTLLIEFGTLSKLTGNQLYYNKAKKALVELFNRRSNIGLVGSAINIETGKWVNSDSHISGGIDSYYEYLLKSWKLFGDKDCRNMWEASIKSVNKYLADSVSSGFWYGHSDMNTGKRTSTMFGALDAFFPACLALSGDINRAKKLEASCYKMWNLEGIEPELINYKKMEITYPQYVLRPEIIESAYYLYHYTHDEKYLEMGITFLNNIVKYCRTPVGFASLKSVITKEKEDDMESFFFAETLKYLYLLFAPPNTLEFDKIIFNTEAHPVQRSWK